MKINKTSVVFIVVALVVGVLLGRSCQPETRNLKPETTAAQAAVKFWSCAMHPHINLPGPGLCPICNMELSAVREADYGEVTGIRELRLSPAAQALAEVETALVERRFVTKEVRLVGKIDYDESRLAYLTSWVPGRLDRLFVDYTGVRVAQGDHMVSIYSPELLAAQEELIQAIGAMGSLEGSAISMIKERAGQTVTASREKLRLWGLTDEQIRDIEKRKRPDDHLTIYSPISGIVIHKNALEGAYVKTGTRIYTIADLSQVWVKLDAYESDLSWIHYGQDVTFETESYPGRRFKGTVAFIDPMLNEQTRTVKVRVNVDNTAGALKPGMFVRATVASNIAQGGRVMHPRLAGKMICPMHPEIIKKESGDCDICGMPLVSTEDFGYLPADADTHQAPLVIPASAPLITGKRAVVYVKLPAQDGVFEGREILLGPRAGEYYLVASGLREGERVVTRGAFKLDAEMQINAKPSMMSPRTQHDPSQISPEFRVQLKPVVDGYLDIQGALAGDDFASASAAAKQTRSALDGIDMSLVAGDAYPAWMKQQEVLKSALSELADAENMETIRAAFAPLSEQFIALLSRYGVPEGKLYQAWCPMAFDNQGAAWIQREEKISNPYYGEQMLRCGEIKQVLK